MKVAKRKKREASKKHRKVQEARQRLNEQRFPKGRFPTFALGRNDAAPEFVDKVMSILNGLDFRDRCFFTEKWTKFFEGMKQVGLERALAGLLLDVPKKLGFALKQEACHRVGEVLFRLLDGQGELLKYIPFTDVNVIPLDKDFVVNFDSLSATKSRHGMLYYPRSKPTIEVEGKPYVVAFHRHAIERICERVSGQWKTYVGMGDAFPVFAQCQFVGLADVYHGGQMQRAFTVFDYCGPGFITGTMRNKILGTVEQGKWYGFRLGYCPIDLDGEFASARTFLYAGMRGTPEYGLLMKSNLSSAEKSRFQGILDGICRNRFADPERVVHPEFLAMSDNMCKRRLDQSGPIEVFKWFHESGIPQIVELAAPQVGTVT